MAEIKLTCPVIFIEDRKKILIFMSCMFVNKESPHMHLQESLMRMIIVRYHPAFVEYIKICAKNVFCPELKMNE